MKRTESNRKLNNSSKHTLQNIWGRRTLAQQKLPAELSFFGRRGNRTEREEDIESEAFYSDKRNKIAIAFASAPESESYITAVRNFCCCSGKGYVNAGCVIHGFGAQAMAKAWASRSQKRNIVKSKDVM